MNQYKTYTVTVTYKYQSVFYSRETFTVEVLARSKKDANATARRQLEREGHYFSGNDVVTFSAKEAVA